MQCQRCGHQQSDDSAERCEVCSAYLQTIELKPKKKKPRKRKWKPRKPTQDKAAPKLEDIVMKCSFCGKEKKFLVEDPEGAWLRSLAAPGLQTICASCLAQGKTLQWPEL